MLCTECGAGLTCSTGACVFGSSGGGASGTGGGFVAAGGNASGGVARLDQDLVSGSRLRAINFVGGDGSRAPAVFWDNQLNTVCAASAVSGPTPRCFPALLMTTLVPNFGDPACTQQIFGNLLTTLPGEPYVAAGLPSPQIYGVTATTVDGGAVTTFHTLVPATARYLQSGANCTAGTLGPNMYVSSGVVPVTSFLAMPMVRE